MRLRAVVLGIPGVGKTTIVRELSSLLRGSKVVTFGTIMFEEAKERKWVKHRDELRKLTVEKQGQLQALAAKKIARMKESVVLVDTHLFIRTREGFWPGLPFDVVRPLKPTHLVLVEADPEDIARRRASDASRNRDAIKLTDIEFELDLAREFLAVTSILTGAPLLLATNAEGKAKEASSRIAHMLRGAAA